MTKKEKEKWAAALLIGGGAFLLWHITRPKAAPLPPPVPPEPEPQPEPEPEPLDLTGIPPYQAITAYEREFNDNFQIGRQGPLLGFGEGVMQRQAPFAQAWTVPNLAWVTLAVAEDMDIAPEIIWGIMRRESSWVPVGRFGNSDSTNMTATEYGMGQITRGRWNAEADSDATPSRVTQIDIIHPELTIASIAMSYKRGQAKHGGSIGFDGAGFTEGVQEYVQAFRTGETEVNQSWNPPEWVGAWWARPADIPRPFEQHSDMSKNVFRRIAQDGTQIRRFAALKSYSEATGFNLDAGTGPSEKVELLVNELEQGGPVSGHQGQNGFTARMVHLATQNKPTPDDYISRYAPGDVQPELAEYFLAGSAFFPQFESSRFGDEV